MAVLNGLAHQLLAPQTVSAKELVARAQAAGLTLTADGDGYTLIVAGPAHLEPLVRELGARKAAVMEVLGVPPPAAPPTPRPKTPRSRPPKTPSSSEPGEPADVAGVPERAQAQERPRCRVCALPATQTLPAGWGKWAGWRLCQRHHAPLAQALRKGWRYGRGFTTTTATNDDEEM